MAALYAYARAKDCNPALRFQALAAVCRKADEEGAREVADWYAEAAPEVRSDILNAIGQGGNTLFLPLVTDLAAKAEDDSAKSRIQHVRDLLAMAERRCELGLKP